MEEGVQGHRKGRAAGPRHSTEFPGNVWRGSEGGGRGGGGRDDNEKEIKRGSRGKGDMGRRAIGRKSGLEDGKKRWIASDEGNVRP